MAALVAESGKGYIQFCGGSVIRAANPPIILTAAHCLYGLKDTIDQLFNDTYNLTLDIAKTSIQNSTERDYVTLFWDWDQIKIHKNFNPDKVINDIALIQANDTPNSNKLSAIEYWNTSDSCCVSGNDVRAFGYGLNETNGTATRRLEYTDLDYIDPTTCNKWIDKWLSSSDTMQDDFDFENYDWSSYTATDQYIYPGMFCAFQRNSDTCQGDSGGPLLKGKSENDPQVGVVSWGFGCADNVPGVYTDLAYFQDWIEAAKGCLIYEANGDNSYSGSCDKLDSIESAAEIGSRVNWLCYLLVVFTFMSTAL
jgi:secreted trypsin-like serine protease